MSEKLTLESINEEWIKFSEKEQGENNEYPITEEGLDFGMLK